MPQFLVRGDTFHSDGWVLIEADSPDDACVEYDEDDDCQTVSVVPADHVMTFRRERSPFVRVQA